MKLLRLNLALLLVLCLSNNLYAQTGRFQFGMEPFYNYGIYSGDQFFNPYERINIIGLGFYSEYQLNQEKDNWAFKSGLYYFQFHSKSNQTVERNVDCNEIVFLASSYYINIDTKYISHYIRIPAIFNFRKKRFTISGGLVFDFEITNKEKIEAKLNPTEVCIDDPYLKELAQGISLEHKRNNSFMSIGPVIGFGYHFAFSSTSVTPVITYSYMLGFEHNFANTKYSRNYHALGIGIKLYF